MLGKIMIISESEDKQYFNDNVLPIECTAIQHIICGIHSLPIWYLPHNMLIYFCLFNFASTGKLKHLNEEYKWKFSFNVVDIDV